MNNTAEAIEVVAGTVRLVEAHLNAAVLHLQLIATRTRTYGILVTRQSPGRYTVALSDEVPFGLTHERHA